MKQDRKIDKKQTFSRGLHILTGVLFILNGWLNPWFSDGKKEYTILQFFQSVQEAGGIAAFSKKTVEGGDTLLTANLTLSYYSLWLIGMLAVVLLVRIFWMLIGRKGRVLNALSLGLAFLYVCVFMIFYYYSYGRGLLMGMLLMLADGILGKFLDERKMLQTESARIRAKEKAEKEERKWREGFPGQYSREFYRVIFKNFRANVRDYLMFLGGATLTMMMLHIIWGMGKSSGGIQLVGASALQLEIGTNMRQMLPLVLMLVVLMLAMIINSYLKTRMKNYGIYTALGIRNKTLMQIVGLEYGTCILLALVMGSALGMLVMFRYDGSGFAIHIEGILCYLGAILLATLINYHLFEFKNIMRYNRSAANEKVFFGGTGILVILGLVLMLSGIGLFSRRGNSENILWGGLLILGVAFCFYGIMAKYLKRQEQKIRKNPEKVLQVLPWRNRFQSNYLFLMLLITLEVTLFGIFVPRLAADQVEREPKSPYDYIAMVYETDHRDIQELSKEEGVDTLEIPMLRVTTPLGANVSWMKQDYRMVLWPQGQHVAISESSYRKLCQRAGLEPERFNLPKDGTRVHIVIQQDAAMPAHNLEWYSGGGGNLFRIGQPLLSYDPNVVPHIYLRHQATYERRILTGSLQGGTQENLVVLSDSYFNRIYRMQRVEWDPSGTKTPSVAKEGPSNLILIQLKAGSNHQKVEKILNRVESRHLSDQQYDESVRSYYKTSDCEKNNRKSQAFRHQMNQIIGAGLFLMVLFSFCIKLSLGQDEQQRQYRLLDTLGMSEREQKRLFDGEMRRYILGSLGVSILLSLPFAAILPHLRMIIGRQLGEYWRSLGILLGLAAVGLYIALGLLAKYFRRANR